MVVHGLYWLAFNLAAPATPLLLVVDDGHWADEASLRWLAYLASRLEGLDVSLVVAMRPDPPARERGGCCWRYDGRRWQWWGRAC